jgi:hypothetical protein
MALAVGMGTDVQGDGAVRRNSYFHSFGLVARTLAMQRQADAAAQSALLTLKAPLRKSGPVCELKRLIK